MISEVEDYAFFEDSNTKHLSIIDSSSSYSILSLYHLLLKYSWDLSGIKKY